MKDIFLTNTLTGKKEKFTPLTSGKVKMYSCGPTVYDFAHIGNFRSFLLSDLLFRVLQYAGYEVQKVQNITDVGHLTNDDLADADGDDKILKKAKAEKKDPFEIARNFEQFFVEDEAALRIIPPNAGRPRATDFIPEQIALANDLIEKGFAYVVNGSVYFRTARFKEYGKLSGNNLEDLNAGARVEVNDEKESPLDFALWKKADQNHLMKWDYETGEKLAPDSKNPNAGFPGWHIECSAMSRELLGESFDIHTGGEDNIFPHHECEIAQNECSHGGKIKYWLHTKHLLVDGTKMSKSKGNFYTIRDIFEKGYSGAEIRYLLLSAHYRTAMNFTFEGLEMARSSIARISEFMRKYSSQKTGSAPLSIREGEGRGPEVSKLKEKFQTALFDDLNVSDALATAFEAVSFGNKNPELAGEVMQFLKEDFDPIFDIFPKPQKDIFSPEQISEIEQLITERNTARTDKNWTRSDEIRDLLTEQFNIELLDEFGKTSWKIKN